MNKIFITIATMALLTLFTSAYNNQMADSRVGYQAPNFTVERGDSTVSLQQLRGQRVMVTFWSTTDGESRLSNMKHDRNSTHDGMTHLSVNMDRSEGVYQMAIRMDRLHKKSQFHADSAQQEELTKAWRLDGRSNTFIIGPDGRIEEIL